MPGTSLNRQRQIAVALSILLALVLVSCGKEGPPTGPTPPPPPPPPPPATEQRSTGPIAFVSDRDGSHAIYLANEDGSKVTRLTATSVYSYPAWSPGGGQLAFARQPEGIYVVNVDGSGLRRIWSQGSTWAGGPVDWSPDGSKLAITVFNSPESGIFVMNTDGSNVTLVISHEFAGPGCGGGWQCSVDSPAWSRNGHEIAFFSWGGYGFTSSNLVAISVDGGQRRILLADYGGSPAWSPDGTKIAFHARPEIGLVSADGSGRPQFLQISGEDPRWAPDGSIVFSALNDAGRRRVFISTGSGSRRQLIPEATAPVNPGYSDCCAVWTR